MSDPFIRAWAPGTRPEWAEEPGQFATEAISPPAPAPSVPVRVETLRAMWNRGERVTMEHECVDGVMRPTGVVSVEPGRFATEAIPAPTPAPSVPVRVEIDMLAIDDADAAAIGRRILDMMGATWPTLRVVQAVRVVRR